MQESENVWGNVFGMPRKIAMRFKWFLFFLVFFVACNGTSQTSQHSDESKNKPKTQTNKGKQLRDAYRSKLLQWSTSRRYEAADFGYEKPDVVEYLAKFKKLAAENPDSEIAAEAHAWICTDSCIKEEADKSLKVLMEDYFDSAQMARVAIGLSVWAPSAELEATIKKILEESSNKDVKGAATYSLIKLYLKARKASENVGELEANPEVVQQLGDEGLAYLKGFSIDDSVLEELYVSLAGEYRGVVYQEKTVQTPKQLFGGFADEELYKLRNLWPGRKALEISGRDLDGVEFKLSDYRGKVVMLYFWGDWCHYCRERYPHHLALVDRLADKPFALIGVNSGSKLEEVLAAVEQQGISWRSFWDDTKFEGGEISKAWRVIGIPVVWVIDQNGTIRYKGGIGPKVDETISALLNEMGHEVDLGNINTGGISEQ